MKTNFAYRRIEALANIVAGLDPWIYQLGVPEEVLSDDLPEITAYDKALKQARRELLWDLASDGALDGAVVYDECGEPYETIVRLDTRIWMLITVNFKSAQQGAEPLAMFCEMIESYVGKPDTKAYGSDAIVELARDWLAEQKSTAA